LRQKTANLPGRCKPSRNGRWRRVLMTARDGSGLVLGIQSPALWPKNTACGWQSPQCPSFGGLHVLFRQTTRRHSAASHGGWQRRELFSR
jgi:hypothetical protein